MVWGGNGTAHENADLAMMEILRGIATWLEAIEMTQRRGGYIEDVSDDEGEEVVDE